MDICRQESQQTSLSLPPLTHGQGPSRRPLPHHRRTVPHGVRHL